MNLNYTSHMTSNAIWNKIICIIPNNRKQLSRILLKKFEQWVQKLCTKNLHSYHGNFWNTVEPRFNEPRFNEPRFHEVLDITNDILCPGQSYSKMYGVEPQYNKPQYNKFFDIMNIIRKPRCKICLDITNYNVNTRQKINAEQINCQQIL